MARVLTPAVLLEIAKDVKYPVVFVHFQFDSGPLRLWSGVGTMNWNGEDWLGAGDLGEVSPIEETTKLEAPGVKFKLSGIPLENLALALDEVRQGLPVEAWLGFLTNAGEIIADPASVFYGETDTAEITENGETADITISAESRMQLLSQKKERRRTHEDQQIDYPGDLGLEYVAGLQNKQIRWQ